MSQAARGDEPELYQSGVFRMEEGAHASMREGDIANMLMQLCQTIPLSGSCCYTKKARCLHSDNYIQRVQMIEMQDDSYLYSKIISLYDGTRGYN